MRGLIRCTAINSICAVSTHVFLCALNSWQEVQILWLHPCLTQLCLWLVGSHDARTMCLEHRREMLFARLSFLAACRRLWSSFGPSSPFELEWHGSSLWPVPAAVCVLRVVFHPPSVKASVPFTAARILPSCVSFSLKRWDAGDCEGFPSDRQRAPPYETPS